MMMAFAPNKTSSGFNQGGFKFMKPQGNKTSSTLAPLTAQQKRRDRAHSAGGSRRNKNGKASIKPQPQQAAQPTPVIENDQEDQQQVVKTQQKQKLDLIQFYCRILEKGLKNSNPIIVQRGGRDAFLQDIEKLKNAQEAVQLTLERLNQHQEVATGNGVDIARSPKNMIENIPIINNGLNHSGFESSMVSPMALDSLQGGTLEQNYKLQEGSSPVGNSKMQSKIGHLDYSQDNLNFRSKTPHLDITTDHMVTSNQPGKQRLEILMDQSPITPKNQKYHNQNQSNNNTLVADEKLDSQLRGDSALSQPQILSQININQENGNLPLNKGDNIKILPDRISPYQLEPALLSNEIATEINLRNLLEKSLLGNDLSIQTGGDKQRVNIISKFNKSQTSQSHMGGAIGTIQSIEVGILPEKTFDQEIHQQPPIVELLLNAQSSPGDDLMNAQVYLHRQRQRNNEDKIKVKQDFFMKTVSPNKERGLFSLMNQNQESDLMWTPPDMSKAAAIEKKLKNNAISHQNSLDKTPRGSRSPKKEFGSPFSAKKFSGQMEVSLSSQLMHIQALQGALQPSAPGIGGLGRQLLKSQGHLQSSNSQFASVPTHPDFQETHSKPVPLPQLSTQPQVQPPSQQQSQTGQWLNPMIVNIGSLSHFTNVDGFSGWKLGDGCFNPYRSGFTAAVNEQRFYKTGGMQQMRAQTAGSALRGKTLSNNETMNLIRVEDRKTITLNNGENAPEYKSLGPKDGTVVLQATLTLGNRQYQLNPVDQKKLTGGQQSQTIAGNAKLKNNLQAQSPKQSTNATNAVFQLYQSSDLKVRHVLQNTNNPTVIQQTTTGMFNQTSNTNASDTSLFFKCTQISPRHLTQYPVTIIPLNGTTDGASPGAQTAACVTNLQRKYEGSSFMMMQQTAAAAEGNPFDERRLSTGNKVNTFTNQPIVSQQPRSRELQKSQLQNVSHSNHAGRDYSNNSGSYSRRQQHRLTLSNESRHNNTRKNVLAKSKNKIIDYSTQQPFNSETPTAQLAVNLPVVAPGASSNPAIYSNEESKRQLIQHGEITIETNGATDSIAFGAGEGTLLQQSKSRSKNDSHARILSAHPQFKENNNHHNNLLNTNSMIRFDEVVSQVTAAAVGMVAQSSQTPQPRSGGNTPQQKRDRKGSQGGQRQINISGDQVGSTNRDNLMSQQVQMKREEGALSDDNAKQFNSSSNVMGSTTFYSSKQRQNNGPNSMNQTGISFNKTVSDKQSSVRVSLQSRRNEKKKGIEFKILQMNLMMAPTSEKSNMMTCELDLTQHMPLPQVKPVINHKRILSGGQNTAKYAASRTLIPNASNVFINNTASFGQMMVMNSQAVNQASQKNWREINQVKLSIGGETQQPIPTSIEQIQKLNLLRMQRNMPGAAATTSGSGGVPLGPGFQPGKFRNNTPGALSQRSSLAGGNSTLNNHNTRGLGFLFHSNNTSDGQGSVGNQLPSPPTAMPHQPRVQTTNENKRISVIQVLELEQQNSSTNPQRTFILPQTTTAKSYQSKQTGRRAFGSSNNNNNGSNSNKNQDIAHQLSETTLFLKKDKQSDNLSASQGGTGTIGNLPVNLLGHKSSTILEPFKTTNNTQNTPQVQQQLLNNFYQTTENVPQPQFAVTVNMNYPKRSSNLFRGGQGGGAAAAAVNWNPNQNQGVREV